MIDLRLSALAIEFLANSTDDRRLAVATRLRETGGAAAEVVENRSYMDEVGGRPIRMSVHDPFELMLHVLPESACWQLACDFAEHVFPIWTRFAPSGGDVIRRAIDARLAWLRGDATDTEVASTFQTAWRMANNVRQTSGDCLPSWAASEAGKAAAAPGTVHAACLAAARFARTARGNESAIDFVPDSAENAEYIDPTKIGEKAERDWQQARIVQYFRGEIPMLSKASTIVNKPGPPPAPEPTAQASLQLLHPQLALRRTVTNRPAISSAVLGRLEFKTVEGHWSAIVMWRERAVSFELYAGGNLEPQLVAEAESRFRWLQKNATTVFKIVDQAILKGSFKTRMQPPPTPAQLRHLTHLMQMVRIGFESDRTLTVEFEVVRSDSSQVAGMRRVDLRMNEAMTTGSLWILNLGPSVYQMFAAPIPTELSDYANSLPDQFIVRQATSNYLPNDSKALQLLAEAIDIVKRRQDGAGLAAKQYLENVQEVLESLQLDGPK